MSLRTAVTVAALAALLPPTSSIGEDRPDEADLFGAPPAAAEPAPPSPAQPAHGEGGRDEAILGGASSGRPTGILSAAQENPLVVGGQIYLRTMATWYRGSPPADWPLGSPNLVDLYVDTRPNDRVRAFALARTSWNPLSPAALLPGMAASDASTDPHAVLDQLWVSFDVGRRVFVTAGRQHVKWGVGRFWNPTDYLHPVRRDPLAVFDDRTGATMVKIHVPWEAKGWNLYGVALLDDPAGRKDAANEVGKVAGGARAEVVLGPAELGADALVRYGQRPRFGFDFSAGIWDFDVHGELALRTSSDVQLWEEVDPDAYVLSRWRKRSIDGILPQAVLGVSWEANYSDEDAVRLGGEYFYNGAGYDDAHIYPWLLLDQSWSDLIGTDVSALLGYPKGNDFLPSYVGRHYAGLFALLAQPGSWNDTTFTLSALANLSDGSAILRLDHSVVVNTYLTVETFLSGNVGKQGGEFRFSLDLSKVNFGGLPVVAPPASPPPVLSGGVALRVKL